MNAIVEFKQVHSTGSGHGFVVLIVHNHISGSPDRYDVINIHCQSGKCITVGRELELPVAIDIFHDTMALNRSARMPTVLQR